MVERRFRSSREQYNATLASAARSVVIYSFRRLTFARARPQGNGAAATVSAAWLEIVPGGGHCYPRDVGPPRPDMLTLSSDMKKGQPVPVARYHAQPR